MSSSSSSSSSLSSPLFPPLPTPSLSDPRPSNVGILSMDVYFPKHYITQSDLELYTSTAAGKYTIGLGQESMAFVNNDREDIYSLLLSAVKYFINKYSIDISTIGKLVVGTETILDHSKSIKSILMQLFPSPHHDIEGIDCINACYGGTAALFSVIDWIESSSWDGRYGLVVCGDIAEYEEGPARPTGGAGACVILIGPSAPIIIDRRIRSSYFDHVWDFYKSNFHSPYPLVDGKFSANCYLKALDYCWDNYKLKVNKYYQKNIDIINNSGEGEGEEKNEWKIDYMVFHSPYNKLVQKSFARLLYNDYLTNSSAPLYKDIPSSIKEKSKSSTYEDTTIEKTFVALSKELYKKKVSPSILLPQQLGNCYTASLYIGLASLLYNNGPLLAGRRLLLFSYGSGLASSMFSFTVDNDQRSIELLSIIQNNLSLKSRLESRKKHDPSILFQSLNHRASLHSLLSFIPNAEVDVQPYAYYLLKKDDRGRRIYAIADENGKAKKEEKEMANDDDGEMKN